MSEDTGIPYPTPKWVHGEWTKPVDKEVKVCDIHIEGHIPHPGDEEIDRIRKSVDIVSIIREFIELKPISVESFNLIGRCPFHEDTIGVFNVSQEYQIYKCFGCEAGGDVFEFIKQKSEITFKQAAAFLRQRVSFPAIHDLQEFHPLDTQLQLEATMRILNAIELTCDLMTTHAMETMEQVQKIKKSLYEQCRDHS